MHAEISIKNLKKSSRSWKHFRLNIYLLLSVASKKLWNLSILSWKKKILLQTTKSTTTAILIFIVTKLSIDKKPPSRTKSSPNKRKTFSSVFTHQQEIVLSPLPQKKNEIKGLQLLDWRFNTIHFVGVWNFTLII